MWDETTPLGKRLAGSRLPALDGLRMVAVILVILGHGGLHVPSDLGVTAFFVLSGFLITWLLMKERDRTQGVALGSFYLRRAFRLLPAYYLYLAIAMALHFRRADARTDVIAPSLLYFANYFNATHGHPVSPIAHTWSLAVEEQFYFLWPLLFSRLARVSRRASALFLVAAIVAVAVWRSTLRLHFGVSQAWTYNAFDCRFDNLAVGCLLAVLSPHPRFLAAARAAASHPALPLLPLGALWLLHRTFVADYQHSIGFTVDALLIGLLIIQLVQLADHGGWRWLEHRAARYLGAISYPMYLYHGVGYSAGKRLASLGLAVQMVGNLAAVIVVASVSYHLVEKPIMGMRERVLGWVRGRRAATAPAP